jgi:hypothetical protein
VPTSIRAARREKLRKRRLSGSVHLASVMPALAEYLEICEMIGF